MQRMVWLVGIAVLLVAGAASCSGHGGGSAGSTATTTTLSRRAKDIDTLLVSRSPDLPDFSWLPTHERQCMAAAFAAEGYHADYLPAGFDLPSSAMRLLRRAHRACPAVRGIREANRCLTEEHTLKIAVEAYNALQGEYPRSTADLLRQIPTSEGSPYGPLLRRAPRWWTVASSSDGKVIPKGTLPRLCH